jgi:hypothetical protein
MQPDQRPHRDGAGGAVGVPRRPCDRLEDVVAWLLASVLFAAAIAAVLVGARTHADVLEMARVQAAERTPVMATVTRDAPSLAGGDTTVIAPVRWTGNDGVARVGDAQMPIGLTAGDTVPIWVDRSNRVVGKPVGPADAVIAGACYGAALFAVVAAALLAVWKGLRRWILARNCARWEREWAQVEPIWSGRRR